MASISSFHGTHLFLLTPQTKPHSRPLSLTPLLSHRTSSSSFPHLHSSRQLQTPYHPHPHPLSAAALDTAAETVQQEPQQEEERKEEKGGLAKVGVKGMENRPRLVLKFVWMEKNIGLALDQVIPGHGSVPLSPYYFWPRKDAWEELKSKLEEKPWISQKRIIILLNQATDIINLWQQSGGNLQ
ncbi:30S ribosomal protein 3-1, chloroplastic-like [Iris pallida]|uniref:30S ribosomal protein 3, chloroplastic n=1 Tax=Iris pallida TaxID=29817 RepID=A0AAX6E524_IRIPA|nr:30S ribosomal protein 3-1, chloroplastic-like [Iris pallida]